MPIDTERTIPEPRSFAAHCNEDAGAIRQLEAENTELRKALKGAEDAHDDERRCWSDEFSGWKDEVAELKRWVSDLQAGMYINCVYCGHRYGPDDEVPSTMADALKEHVERCPKHPMSKLRTKLSEAQRERDEARRQMHKPVDGVCDAAYQGGAAAERERLEEILERDGGTGLIEAIRKGGDDAADHS